MSCCLSNFAHSCTTTLIWTKRSVDTWVCSAINHDNTKWTIFNGWTKWRSWNFSFSRNVQIHGSRHWQATITMRCLGANSPDSRIRAVHGSDTSALRIADTSALRIEDQHLQNRTSLTSWAHCGSLSKQRELVLSSLPNPPPPLIPSADSRPSVYKVACLISLYLLSTCMYHTFSRITFLGYNHMHSRASVFLHSLLSEHIIRCHMRPLGRLLPAYNTRFFLQKGYCCQGKEVVPFNRIRGKGLSSRLTSGSKISLTAGFEPCPQGPAPSSLAAAHSPFNVYLVVCIQYLCWLHDILPWLSSITFFQRPSFLGLLTICISPIEQCALVL